MISPDRRLMQTQIYNFLRSVTIKYEPLAYLINDVLVRKNYIVDLNDKTSWKYYLNLTGQYHESDTVMYVTSLDTRQQIVFSPQTLANNLRTKAVYVPGGPYYNRLCALYPEQVDLIKSILFPVSDITKAIMADDLTLLRYGSDYLEPYEESVMIMEIERFLAIYKERWYFTFLDDEPYFHLTTWSSLWVQLAMLIMSCRVAHIKTSFVHSWDLWNELEANGLDNYSDILDREKAMMLYQNIDYLKVNAGKQSNLNILTTRILEPFGVTLYGRNVLQESETGAANYQLTPQLIPIRITSENDIASAGVQVKTVSEIQSEIYSKGLTSSNSQEKVLTVERQLGDTTLNDFATKFMEIKPIQQIKPYAEVLNSFLMESLIVSATQGYYTQPVTVYDPLTNDPIILPPKELLALYHYAVLMSMGLTPTQFPTMVELYKSFTPVIGTPTLTIPYFESKLYLSQVVDVNDYLTNLSYDQNIQNPGEFSVNVTNLWLKFMGHLLLDEGTCSDKAHHAYSYLSTLCHTRRQQPISLVTGFDSYDDWLGEGGLDLTSTILAQYTIQSNPRDQWGNLADAIISTLVPPNDTLAQFGNFTPSPSSYARLRQLFVQLTSYHLVFLESSREISDFVINAKWSTRYGPDTMDTFGELSIGFNVATSDTATKTNDLHLHRGFVEHRQSDMMHPQSYSVTSKDVKQDRMTNHTAIPKAAALTKGSTMMSNTLRLAYRPPLPVTVD